MVDTVRGLNSLLGVLPLNTGGDISPQDVRDLTVSAWKRAHHSTSLTYISGTGTDGADNTAQTLLTRVLPAGALSVLGDRMRVRAYFQATGGAPISGFVKVGPAAAEVECGSIDVIGTGFALVEAWLHYVDNTHANIIEQHPAELGPLSAMNVAGFTWNAQQNILFTQSAQVAQHLVLIALIIDIFPLGIDDF